MMRDNTDGTQLAQGRSRNKIAGNENADPKSAAAGSTSR